MKKERTPFGEFWFGLSLEDRARFAERCEKSPGYLQLVAGGHKPASPKLAKVLEEQTARDGRRVAREQIRPDVFGGAAP